MHSWYGKKVLEAAARFRVVHRYELTAVGAMLICLAVLLNIGPFTRTPPRDAARATAEQSVASSSIAWAPIGAGTHADRARADMDAMNISETIRPTTELASIPDGMFARLAYQPGKPKDRDGATQPEPVRHDHGTSDPAAQPLASIAGIWAPDTGACSARDFRDGMLPTIINTDGAWAGETFCLFKNRRQTETGWRVIATCSNPREHWSTEVRLTVRDNRLIWTSRRGTQAYTRCAPDYLMAAAR
jgi:hypothetical protein